MSESGVTDMNGRLTTCTWAELDKLTNRAARANDEAMVKQIASERTRRESQPAIDVDDHARRVGSIKERRLDFSTWEDGAGEADWLIEPFIARGRGHALYATAKVGKSYVVLPAIAAACTTGHGSWTEPLADPITVMYVDYEMTASDVFGRLGDWGYSPADNLGERLIYTMRPEVGDLDTPEGGRALVDAAQGDGVDLVVIDTLSRAVNGKENDSDTLRDFYRYTGGPLKSAGIAMLRLDHAGKDRDKGQRGTSAKNDDVDIVWNLEMADKGRKLTRTHSRPQWVPESINLRFDEVTGLHVRVASGYQAGTSDHVDEWFRLGIPIDASRQKAKAMGLKVGTHGFADVRRAVKERVEREGIKAVLNSSAPVEHQSTEVGAQPWKSPGPTLGGLGTRGPTFDEHQDKTEPLPDHLNPEPAEPNTRCNPQRMKGTHP